MGMRVGGLHVRRSQFINGLPGRIWEEFTTFERLAAWFGIGHRLEAYQPCLGGRIDLSVELDGKRRRFGGEVLVFEPNRELSFSENWESDGWPVPAYITIRLTAMYGGCHVELFHHGFERLGADAADELEGHELGWHGRHLAALRAIVEADE